MRRWWNDTTGWLLLQVAAVLHSRVASKTAWGQWQDRRDATVRAAHDRGVPVEQLAARLELTESWIRQKVAKGKKPAVEEAA